MSGTFDQTLEHELRKSNAVKTQVNMAFIFVKYCRAFKKQNMFLIKLLQAVYGNMSGC